ncbi:hypothetical protein VNI00_018809 [Paramarasmius palmivorus]|uniref:Uncharacterized protein n=1 Tax=Paramarasmius palmivorus TaxID=297713 RepID=A0AAW0AUJ4_9AGAR
MFNVQHLRVIFLNTLPDTTLTPHSQSPPPQVAAKQDTPLRWDVIQQSELVHRAHRQMSRLCNVIPLSRSVSFELWLWAFAGDEMEIYTDPRAIHDQRRLLFNASYTEFNQRQSGIVHNRSIEEARQTRFTQFLVGWSSETNNQSVSRSRLKLYGLSHAEELHIWINSTSRA